MPPSLGVAGVLSFCAGRPFCPVHRGSPPGYVGLEPVCKDFPAERPTGASPQAGHTLLGLAEGLLRCPQRVVPKLRSQL